jgi:hypothetical protein
MEQPSEQKRYKIDDVLIKLREAYTDSSKTKCEACRENFGRVATMCLDEKHSVKKLEFSSYRKAREFLNCRACNSNYHLKHKAERAEDVKTKRFEKSFKSDSQTFLEQYETFSGSISFPVAVYNGRVYPPNFSPKSFCKGKRPP